MRSLWLNLNGKILQYDLKRKVYVTLWQNEKIRRHTITEARYHAMTKTGKQDATLRQGKTITGIEQQAVKLRLNLKGETSRYE